MAMRLRKQMDMKMKKNMIEEDCREMAEHDQLPVVLLMCTVL